MPKSAKPRKQPPALKPQKQSLIPGKKYVLHINSGPANPEGLHQLFRDSSWQELRQDNRLQMKPDIFCSPVTLQGVKDNSYHAVWSNNALVKLSGNEASAALKQYFRVLQVNGFALITVPDIQKIAEFIAKGKIDAALAPAMPLGNFTALELLYGQPEETSANVAALHQTGFTAKLLAADLKEAGFTKIQVKREGLCLWAIAYKSPLAPGAQPQIQINEPDINKLMQVRDEIDKEPEQWSGFIPPATPVA